MKVCQRLVILIGLSILVPHCPLVGQEQSASSNSNTRMRIRSSSSLALARMEAEPLPEYPKEAIDKHVEGTVILHVIVSDDGTVKQAEAVSGPSELTKSAIDAVKQWRFGKTLLNQQPVEIDTTLALVYALRPIPAVSVDKDYKPAPRSNASTQEGASTNTPSSVRNVPPNRGIIDGTTYKNSSIGLQFTPAEGLRLQQLQGAAPDMIAVQAQNDPGPMYGLTLFYADELVHYPEDQRNATGYLEKVVIRANESGGFQRTAGEPSAEISGIQFVRADFVKGAVHETILVMTHNVYAFVFVFSGSSAERTGKLIASTDLKVTP